MALLTWDDRLLVGVEPMDQTHREFVELLGELARTDGTDALPVLDRLIEHTVIHFGQEDAWMAASGWGPPCHTGEHRNVLDILRTVRQRAGDGEMQLIGILARELGPWFEHHAGTMDASLVAHMANVGYQPVPITLPLATEPVATEPQAG